MNKKDNNLKEWYKVHKWLKYYFGKANKCEDSNCKKISNTFEWSLLKDKKYEKVRSNFQQLCRSCHTLYDATELLRTHNYRRRILSESTVKKLRKEYKQGLSYNKLSKKYDINLWTVRNVIVKRRYANI